MGLLLALEELEFIPGDALDRHRFVVYIKDEETFRLEVDEACIDSFRKDQLEI
jgi:hypothetical protein